MANLNKVMLIGRLGKDPELRHTASGKPVATFSLATNRNVKNEQTNEWEKKADWHDIVLWDKQATLAGQYLTKGSIVYIEGRLQTRKWQDKSGNDRYTTEVVGSAIEFLSSKGEGSRSGSGEASFEPTGSSFKEEPPFQDDDIPF